MQQAEESCAKSIQYLRRQQPSFAGVLPKDDERTPNRER
jgi:hypothetical protein